MRRLVRDCALWVGAGMLAVSAQAEVKPEKIHIAETKKTQSYVRDGLFTGGDKAIDEFVIRDIRRAANPGFDRVVLDLEGNRGGELAAIERAPYFQVSVTPDEKRLVATLYGKPKLGFNAAKVVAAFRKSPVVESVQLFPMVEDSTWTFALELKGGRAVEVFELSNPVRIIIDVQRDVRTQ